jgi:molybdopterin-guanine dinucleotide biosynthesis protein A
MNGFVLAGGQSTRMGRDKALLEWRGRSLIEHALDRLHMADTNPCILGVRPDLERFARVIPDNFSVRGPLGGIEAALSVTGSELNLFLPVDLPFLPVEFLRWMVQRAQLTQAAATIPRIKGRPQPLCAIYHRDLLGGIRNSLEEGDGKVIRVIESSASAAGLRLDLFDAEAMDAAQGGCAPWPRTLPVHCWFQNLNTPQDLARAALEQRPGIH